MKTFKEYLSEVFEKTQTEYASGREALKGLGKAKFYAIVKHPTYQSHQTALRMGTEDSQFNVTKFNDKYHRVEVKTHPYLTRYEIRGSKVFAYHHMVASPDDPNRYMTIKQHGYENK